MYLSRLILNPRSRQVQSEVEDAYQMHRTILRAFTASLPDEAERVLFRLEINPDSGIPVILVQSQNQPDWGWLSAPDNKYLLHEIPDNPAVKAFDLNLVTGQELRFRLKANPTVKISARDKEAENGKRMGLIREEDQISWLTKKLHTAGCHLLQVQVNALGQVVGWRKEGDQLSKISFHAVQYDGLLKVEDQAQLLKHINTGIGSAKAFGFGLLSLAPM